MRPIGAPSGSGRRVPLEVVTHEPGDDASAIHRFRYQVYLTELGWTSADADHDSRTLCDALDDHAVLHSLTDGNQILGTVRTVHAAWLPDLSLIEKTGALAGVERFGAEAVVTTGRFMLAPELRGGTAILRLIIAAADAMREAGIRLNYGDTSPQLLPFYEHLGYRRFAWPFTDPDYGWKFPILMLVRDQKRMAAMGSPLRRVFAGLPDDAEARDWFEATYSHSLEERSERFRGRHEFRRLVESTLGSLADTPLLDGLAEEELHEVLATSTVVSARAGDEVIRQEAADTTMYLLLSGSAGVIADGVEVGSILPGQLIGEGAFTGNGRRSASVVATAQSQLLVLDGIRLARLFERNPELGNELTRRLADIVLERTRP